jgi:hypothetical protein
MSLREALVYTNEICNNDEAFNEYGARERFLAFAYTYLQTLQKEKAKFFPLLKSKNNLIFPNAEVQNLKAEFEQIIAEIITIGEQSGEIVARPIVSNYYKNALWICFIQILVFWANDNSFEKEETDVLTEKSVHFTFDLFLPNAIDSGLDYAKFLLQKR